MEKNRIIKIISVITGFVLIYIGQSIMYGKANGSSGAVFFLLSFIPFFIALKSDKGAELLGTLPFLRDNVEKPGRNEIIGFVIFFIAAAFFRFHNLDTVPIGSFRDEGKAAKDAMDIIRNVMPHGADSTLPIYIRAITDNPALYNYFMGGLFPLVGEGIVGARAATAVAGLLTAVSFYFLIRYMFGWRAAVLGGFLFAVGNYPVTYSRLVYHASFAMLPYMFTMFFALKVYNERKLFDFIILGLAMAISIQTYHAARIIPFAYAAILCLCFFGDRGFIKANYKKMLLMIGVSILVLMPLIIYIFDNYNSFMGRPGGLFLFGENNKHYWFSQNQVINYLISLKKAVLMYNNLGGMSIISSNFEGMPMLDYLSGIFAAAGFMLLLAGMFLGNARSFFFLGMFFIFIQGTALFIESPHTGRGIMAMPMVFIFAAAAIAVLSKLFLENAGKISKILFSLTAVILLLIITADNYDRYFEKYGKYKLAYRAFETEKREAAEYVVKLGDGWQAIMTPYFMHGERGETPDVMIVFMEKGKSNYEKLTLGHNFPVNPKQGMNYIYILERDYFNILPALKTYYPGGEVIEFKEKYNKDNVTAFIAFKVPYEEAVKGMSYKPERGLTASYYTGAECGTGELLDQRIEPMVLQDWAFYPKNIRFFTACWDGKIRIDIPGRYFFDVKTGENKRLLIDNKLILSGNQTRSEIELSKGLHDIHISFRNNGSLWIGLWWVKPNVGYLEPVPMDNLYPKK
ncbi:MAG: glycosyltransferase family 39 protein [Candidatus Goldbacteria bacterium]|nr:glycosyltransferase family 39 protein [Candidatus Goldiibacteriota bacterium]